MSTATDSITPTTGGLGLGELSAQRIKPSTISVNQPNTQADGAIKGKFRLSDSPVQYDDFRLCLLVKNTRREYHVGQKGTLYRKPENLVCYSTDGITPETTSKEVQSDTCATCPMSDWGPRTSGEDKDYIPPCQEYYHVIFADPKTLIPYQMYLRSKIKTAFETADSSLRKNLARLKSIGVLPNVFDLSFKMSTLKITTKGLPSYVIQFTDFKAIEPEERESLTAMYMQYADTHHVN